MRRPVAVMDAGRAAFGDVWLLRLLAGTNFVMVSDPDLIKQVFTAESTVIHGGDANMIATALLGEHSVLLLDEQPHRTVRKLLLPPFHGERMRSYHDAMGRIAEDEIDRWPLGEPIEMLTRMQAITLEVIMATIFGVRGGEHQEALRRRIRALLDWGASPRRMISLHISHRRGKFPPQSFLDVRDPFDAQVYEEIERGRADPGLEEREDILAMLLKARYEDGSTMNDRELRDTLTTLLIQGHTSTGTALAWALERLTRHPEAMERLRSELEEEGDEYLDAVIKEALRLRPPLPFVARRVNQPYELGGYELPVETLIAACIYLVHRRPDVYPEPERFRPERFLEQKEGTYTWIPFGGGERHCLGRSFALAEMKVVLRAVVARTRLEPDEAADEPIARKGILFSPGRGGRVVVRERLPATDSAGIAA
jgi:cytochrome P450